MNLFKSKKNLLLLVSSVIVWLGTCLLAMHWNTVYDGAVSRKYGNANSHPPGIAVPYEFAVHK